MEDSKLNPLNKGISEVPQPLNTPLKKNNIKIVNDILMTIRIKLFILFNLFPNEKTNYPN